MRKGHPTGLASLAKMYSRPKQAIIKKINNNIHNTLTCQRDQLLSASKDINCVGKGVTFPNEESWETFITTRCTVQCPSPSEQSLSRGQRLLNMVALAVNHRAFIEAFIWLGEHRAELWMYGTGCGFVQHTYWQRHGRNLRKVHKNSRCHQCAIKSWGGGGVQKISQ